MTDSHNDSATLTDSQRWRGVCERDKTYDDIFVFAVLTTGIYCRPGCSSRRARRENVSFYNTPWEAEKAGYRACKRCKPDQKTRPPHARAILQACRDIQSAEREPKLTTLAKQVGLSPGHFQRLFKAQVGLSPKQYAMAIRKQRLRDELAQAQTVTSAIYKAGYGSASRAYADKATSGMQPRQHLQGATGETIHYVSAETSQGHVVIAVSAQGVCLVDFVEPKQEMARLKSSFPHAQLQPARDGLAGFITSITARIDHPYDPSCADTPLPLDIRGTAFQENVWNALTTIPLGKTVSYSQLARSLGKPKAARAVARACAANPLAVLVPCHRVVRGSGELAGYKWGIERKRALLKQELQKRQTPRTRNSE